MTLGGGKSLSVDNIQTNSALTLTVLNNMQIGTSTVPHALTVWGSLSADSINANTLQQGGVNASSLFAPITGSTNYAPISGSAVYAPKADPTLTGTTNVANLSVSGTVSGSGFLTICIILLV